MDRPETPIAADIYDWINFIADPATKWVNRYPRMYPGETCLVVNRTSRTGKYDVQLSTIRYVNKLVEAEGSYSIEVFNDNLLMHERYKAIWLLEEALDMAIEEGR